MKYLQYAAAIATAIFAIVILVVSLGRSKTKVPVPDLKLQFRAIDAEAHAKKLEAELGKAKALERIEKEYADAMAKLDESERAEAKKLVDDVPRLARLLAGKKT